MEEFFAYHVVTDRPMRLGQHIHIGDATIESGMYKRVMSKKDIVDDIYVNPNKYNISELEHHEKVAIRELALEEIRKDMFSQYPSRLKCLYVSDTLADAKIWCDCFVNWGRPTYNIVKLKINGKKFVGDSYNCFEPSFNKADNLLMAKKYWQNDANIYGKTPINEILVNGDIEVVEIVEEINKNIV